MRECSIQGAECRLPVLVGQFIRFLPVLCYIAPTKIVNERLLQGPRLTR